MTVPDVYALVNLMGLYLSKLVGDGVAGDRVKKEDFRPDCRATVGRVEPDFGKTLCEEGRKFLVLSLRNFQSQCCSVWKATSLLPSRSYITQHYKEL